MKCSLWLSRLLAYTQTCIGLTLTAFASVTLDMFYFVIGLGNVFCGAIILNKINQGDNQ